MKKFRSKIAVFLSVILIWTTLVPGIGGSAVLAAGEDNVDRDSDGDFNYDPVLGEVTQVDPDFSVEPAAEEQFAEGNIRFEIDGGHVNTDNLFIPEGESVTLGDGSILTFNNGQFLLDDVPIASVNDTDDGEGTALQIDLSAPLPNGNFEEGSTGEMVPSWELNTSSEGPNGEIVDQIWLGDLATKTQGRSYNGITETETGVYTVTGPGNEYTYETNVDYNKLASTDDSQMTEGFEALFGSLSGFVKSVYNDTDNSSQALEIGFLNSLLLDGDYGKKDGEIASSFGIEAISEPFKANKGDKLFFDWKANDGGDDYEVYGFLINESNDNHTEILYGRGSSQGWTTNSGEIPADGTYKFRFVAGSFNRTDGTTHGATLSIDNIKVVSQEVVVGVVDAIGRMVHYENSLYSDDRPINITVTNGDGNPSTVTDSDVVVKMSTQEEAATQLATELTIDSPTDNKLIYDPSEKTITGSTQSGSTVNVTVTDPEGNEVLNEAATVIDDNWSIELTDNLIKGEYTIKALASKGGATSVEEESTFTYVDTTDLEAYINDDIPVIVTAEEDYQAGWSDYQAALGAANDLLDGISDGAETPTQAAVDQALTDLQDAVVALEKNPPIETKPATYEHGDNKIIIDFNKDVKLTNNGDPSDGFTVTVDGVDYPVTDAEANGEKITLTIEGELDSDAGEVKVDYNGEADNLYGDEPNGSADETFTIVAKDEFGAGLQITDTIGYTDDRTPVFIGNAHIDSDSVTLTFKDNIGNVVPGLENVIADLDTEGNWTYRIPSDLAYGGNYTVEVTATNDEGGPRTVTKSEKFFVVNKEGLQTEFNEVDEFVQKDYRAGWEAFEDAREHAGNVLDTPTASQDEVDTALEELEEARDALEKHPPVETNPATYEHGDNKITIEFDKNITLTNTEIPGEGFKVTVDGETLYATDAVADGNKVTLTVDQPLDSDAGEVKVDYTPNEDKPNLFGDEENGTADEPFEIIATDEFGKGLQIIGTKGNTDDRTPSFNGEIHPDADNVTLTIVDSEDNKVVTGVVATIDGEGWTFEDWTDLNELTPGAYTVQATAKDTDTGRTVTKSADFTVVDKTTLQEAVDSGEELKQDDHRAGWDTFAEELEDANNVLNNPTASQDEVQSALGELEEARDALEKHEPEAINARFDHGHDEITISFDKNVEFANGEVEPITGFTVTVDGEEVEVTVAELVKVDPESKTNKVKLTLAEGTELSSDANVKVHYNKAEADSNLFGDEENGTAVEDFEFEAGDPFGHALQIDEPNGITNDLTPIIEGTADKGAESATITITGPDGEEIIVDKEGLPINSDGTWTYDIPETLAPGEYKVEVTTTQTGRPDVTKDHYFTVVDKTALMATDDVITAEELVEDAYTEDSWAKFDQAFNHANDVIADQEATQDQVDQANEGLLKAYEELVYKEQLDKEVVDSESLIPSHYSLASWEDYTMALTHAQEVLNNPASTQEEVDEALEALKVARDALAVDKTMLDAEENQAEELEESDYSQASWSNYLEVLEKAQTVLNDPNATQDEVDEAEAVLAAARAALSVDKQPLDEEESKSEELQASNYTETSWNAYQEALEHAETVLADENATQAEVDAALAELVDAREALEGEEELPDTATDVFNWLMIGLVILLAGFLLLFLQKRRNKANS
ncbi:Ig-like domain-containing protein [Gracilibacillus massiliensis]|uniref:Ig-like domain-containing protein n=1 Tax=Gracilibacillus massiliensis TaxID=1564956 RepID=UPI00071D6C1E|nr:SwmB domain-containing protein [Gracilibacillus massiliensis]